MLLRRCVRFMSTRPPPRPMNEGERLMHAKLAEKFQPTELTVQDLSGGCGEFYAVTISSPVFKGIPVIKQHRMVTDALKEEIGGIHGLQIKTNWSG